jgi:hypothetical protein
MPMPPKATVNSAMGRISDRLQIRLAVCVSGVSIRRL